MQIALEPARFSVFPDAKPEERLRRAGLQSYESAGNLMRDF